MTPIVWSPEMATGVTALDDMHRAVLETAFGFSSVPDAEFRTCYGAMVTKMERSFAVEEQWMEETDFPGIKSHREQHARALRALHEVHPQVIGGNVALGRRVAENLLPQWLVFHISTMDMAWAMQIADPQITHRI